MPSTDPPAPADPRADWIAAHQRAIWRYLRYLGCERDVAEDLLHDTLLAGLRHGMHSRPAGQARAWLRTTAKHLVTDRQRGAARRATVAWLELAEVIWQEQEGSPRRDALRECLSLLDGRSARAVELRYGQGHGRAAIAAALGIGEEGVKSLLQRVRQLLRACIERRCGDEG
ncbi:MAG TPA: RNA polymerase sigma factor [Planctomycetota bacterium]|nr:RNA polymerase sigma factor [Planctomycetota bacterium]